MDDPAAALFCSRSTQVSTTSETQVKSEANDNQLDTALLSKKRSRKSVVALSLVAIAINGAAVVCTIPSVAIDMPDVGGLAAELLPHERAPAPVPDAVIVAALQEIQSAQQQHHLMLPAPHLPSGVDVNNPH